MFQVRWFIFRYGRCAELVSRWGCDCAGCICDGCPNGPCQTSGVSPLAAVAAPLASPGSSAGCMQPSGMWRAEITGCDGPDMVDFSGMHAQARASPSARMHACTHTEMEYTCGGVGTTRNRLSELTVSGGTIRARWTNAVHGSTGSVTWTRGAGCSVLDGGYTNDGTRFGSPSPWMAYQDVP